jgi:GTP diphosphokinase / guanosine-3',5'-bis(diphosphate) 3'-diphosphatase
MSELTKVGLLLAALHFAADKHRDQRRKGAHKAPYINHPIEVAEILARVADTQDTALLLAAVLHDTIEDTQTTPEELEEKFGREVLDIVIECTDDKSLPKVERKRLQIEHASHKSPKAKLVKMADKIANLKDLTNFPPDDWSMQRKQEYVTWSQSVVDGLRGENAALDALFDTTCDQAKIKFEI